MNASEFFGRVNRMQRTLIFKIVASAVVLALAISVVVTYVVRQQRDVKQGVRVEVVARPDGQPANADGTAAPEDPETVKKRESARASAEADARLINDLLGRKAEWSGVAAVVMVVAGVLIGFIWLGLGMVAPLLVGLLALIVWRLKLFSPQDVAFEELGRLDVALLFLGAVCVLASSFLILMELLKLALGGPWAVLAVARNVVNEAVRLKVSLVLIVLLIFGLAALPGLLDPGTPLRYRVQSFLNYGTAGAFWVIGVLVLFLSVGSVTFEQRDRVIWQTMTKPVAAWQYLLGKWLGVSGVAAVLLLVSASGVFAFTEYLARQKAVHEVRPYVAEPGMFISEDRFILESQILAARKTVLPRMPALSEEELMGEVRRRIELAIKQAGEAVTEDTVSAQATPENVSQIRKEVTQESKDRFLAIEAGKGQTYIFKGLGDSKRIKWESVSSAGSRLGLKTEEVERLVKEGKIMSRTTAGRIEIGQVEVRPLTLRYKIQAGGNDPRTTFRVSFTIPGQDGIIVKEVSLNTMMTLPIPASAVDENGQLAVRIFNGDETIGYPNEATFIFPFEDGLSLYYASGSYRPNFFRVILVLWVKLAFLAMVAIWASTYLSFPVASMIAFGVFLIAEGASFIWESLDYYSAEVDGKVQVYRLVIRAISVPIAWSFKHYSEITPIESLSEGRLVSWGTVAWAFLLLGMASAILYAFGVLIFRRRELATYSGQ